MRKDAFMRMDTSMRRTHRCEGRVDAKKASMSKDALMHKDESMRRNTLMCEPVLTSGVHAGSWLKKCHL
jgi:hypothetical protein